MAEGMFPFPEWPQVALRRSSRARSLRLRLDARRGGFVLSAPARASLAALREFLAQHRGWMEGQAAGHVPVILRGEGEVIPFHGRELQVWRTGHLRGVVEIADGKLLVPGEAASCARRVFDFLRQQARRDIVPLVHEKAKAAGASFRRISFRDQRSRWGSCSADGGLSFSFRLVMTPPEVMDYVVAHEVAHLLHHHHGPDFWEACARLSISPDIRTCRAWLKRHGAGVQAIGIDGVGARA